MRFLHLRLQNFRNIGFAEIELGAARTFFIGANGEGKSNLLEALGLVTALRSFRTQNMSALTKQGVDGFAGVYRLEQEIEGSTELEIRSGANGRKVWIDGEPVSKLGDFIGRYPVVPLSSADLMLLRGTPGERRRFLDLTLSAIDPEYYKALRDYHRAVAERNRLLKRGGSDGEFAAFEAEIAPRAVIVTKKRIAGVQRLSAIVCAVYSNIAEADEGPQFDFKASLPEVDVEAVLRILAQNRKRDQILGSTQKGPHRDDFTFSLHVGGAREYASDGQQRGLCVALRIAQARIFEEALGVRPVLLADDVLGELDPHRRAGFWKACPPDLQIIATGTELPPVNASIDWAVWNVRQGAFRREGSY